MKNEKGITLTSLVIYIIALSIIVIMFGVMRNNFENSVKDISQESNLESEFNKFNLYFTKDVKIEGNKAVLDGQNKITFYSGSSYEFINEEKNVVYKNSDKEIKILRNVNSCTFATTIDTETAKTIITVSILFEGADSAITKEYVLLEKEDIGYQNEEEYITITPPATRLPDGYTEVEYIESTGTQYIDTGYSVTSGKEIELTCTWENVFDSNGNIVTVNGENKGWGGNINTSGDSANGFNGGGRQYSNNISFWMGGNSTSSISVKSTKNKKFTDKITIATSGATNIQIIENKTNNILYDVNINRTYNATARSIYLFKDNSDYPFPAVKRIYNFKVIENDECVIDLYPCYRNMDNEIGFYDIVNNVFYTNQGTGEFSYSNSAFVPEYKQVEYIEFTNYTYINTGIIPTNHTTKIKYDFVEYNNDEHLFGTAEGALYYHFTAYSNKYYWGRNGSEGNGGTWTTGIKELVFNGDNNSVVQDGTTLGSGTNITSSSVLLIGARNSVYNLQAKVYEIEIIDKGTGKTVRHLIPYLRKNDNMPGFYDTVNNVFYTNLGSGDLVAGPEI